MKVKKDLLDKIIIEEIQTFILNEQGACPDTKADPGGERCKELRRRNIAKVKNKKAWYDIIGDDAPWWTGIPATVAGSKWLGKHAIDPYSEWAQDKWGQVLAQDPSFEGRAGGDPDAAKRYLWQLKQLGLAKVPLDARKRGAWQVSLSHAEEQWEEYRRFAVQDEFDEWLRDRGHDPLEQRELVLRTEEGEAKYAEIEEKTKTKTRICYRPEGYGANVERCITHPSELLAQYKKTPLKEFPTTEYDELLILAQMHGIDDAEIHKVTDDVFESEENAALSKDEKTQLVIDNLRGEVEGLIAKDVIKKRFPDLGDEEVKERATEYVEDATNPDATWLGPSTPQRRISGTEAHADVTAGRDFFPVFDPGADKYPWEWFRAPKRVTDFDDPDLPHNVKLAWHRGRQGMKPWEIIKTDNANNPGVASWLREGDTQAHRDEARIAGYEGPFFDGYGKNFEKAPGMVGHRSKDYTIRDKLATKFGAPDLYLHKESSEEFGYQNWRPRANLDPSDPRYKPLDIDVEPKKLVFPPDKIHIELPPPEVPLPELEEPEIEVEEEDPFDEFMPEALAIKNKIDLIIEDETKRHLSEQTTDWNYPAVRRSFKTPEEREETNKRLVTRQKEKAGWEAARHASDVRTQRAYEEYMATQPASGRLESGDVGPWGIFGTPDELMGDIIAGAIVGGSTGGPAAAGAGAIGLPLARAILRGTYRRLVKTLGPDDARKAFRSLGVHNLDDIGEGGLRLAQEAAQNAARKRAGLSSGPIRYKDLVDDAGEYGADVITGKKSLTTPKPKPPKTSDIEDQFFKQGDEFAKQAPIDLPQDLPTFSPLRNFPPEELALVKQAGDDAILGMSSLNPMRPWKRFKAESDAINQLRKQGTGGYGTFKTATPDPEQPLLDMSRESAEEMLTKSGLEDVLPKRPVSPGESTTPTWTRFNQMFLGDEGRALRQAEADAALGAKLDATIIPPLDENLKKFMDKIIIEEIQLMHEALPPIETDNPQQNIPAMIEQILRGGVDSYNEAIGLGSIEGGAEVVNATLQQIVELMMQEESPPNPEDAVKMASNMFWDEQQKTPEAR